MTSRSRIPRLQIRVHSSKNGIAGKGTEESAMAIRSFTAVVHKEDDLWVALCPEIGTTSQGHDIDEAVANLREATELYLEEFPRLEVGRSLVTTFELQNV